MENALIINRLKLAQDYTELLDREGYHLVDMNSTEPQMEGWSTAWFVFAAYSLVVAVLFAFIFKYKHQKE